jgi:hypothetical protein
MSISIFLIPIHLIYYYINYVVDHDAANSDEGSTQPAPARLITQGVQRRASPHWGAASSNKGGWMRAPQRQPQSGCARDRPARTSLTRHGQAQYDRTTRSERR